MVAIGYPLMVEERNVNSAMLHPKNCMSRIILVFASFYFFFRNLGQALKTEKNN